MLPQVPIKQNTTLVESYRMWCDLSLDRIYFSITNSSYPSNQCCPLNSLLAIYTASPVITSLFKAFPQVRCLKPGKLVLQFCLDHTKSRTLKWHLDFFSKKEFTEYWILPVGKMCNDSHFVSSQKFTHKKTRQNTNLAPTEAQFILSFKMRWTDQNEVPNMLPTPQILILIFLRMSPLGQATFWSVLVINAHSTLATHHTRSHSFQAQKSVQEPMFFPLSLLQKLLSSFQSSCGISPHFKPKCDAGPLFLQLCCFLRHITITTVTAHTCTQQHTT